MPSLRPAVLAAAASLLLVAACGGASDTTSNDNSTPPTTTGGSATTDAAGTLSGQGYSVVIPADWDDITAEAKQHNSKADVAMAEPQQDQVFRTNFNVVVPNQIDPGVSDAELAKEAARELRTVTKSAVTPVSAPDFDGSPALGQTSSTSASGVDVSLIQYFVVKDGLVYATTMTFGTDQTDQAKATLDEIVGSWTWAS